MDLEHKRELFSSSLPGTVDIRAILLLFLILAAAGSIGLEALEWDEASFLVNAEYFSGDQANFEGSRPHMISYLIAGLWIFTGETTLAPRLMITLFGALSVYIFHRIIRQEFNSGEVLLPALLAFSPLMLYWSGRIYTDVPALALLLGSLYFYRRKNHLAAGTLVALSAVMRYIFLVFAFGMAIGYLIENRENILELLAGGIMGSAPFLAYSQLFYGSPFARIRMYLTRVTRWSDSGAFASVVPGIVSGTYMLSVLIPASYTGWSKSSAVEKAMVTVYTVFIIFFSGNSYYRYWLPVIPFLFLMAYRGLNRNYFAVIAVAALVISGSGVWHNAASQQKCSSSLDQSLEYASRLKGEFVSDSWSKAAYRLDQPVSSTWTDLETLHNDEGIDYAVMSSEEPYHVMASFPDNCRTYHVYNLSRPR